MLQKANVYILNPINERGRKNYPKIPMWSRYIYVTDDGDIFAPAILAGNEHSVVMCALFDGTKMVRDNGHVYLPLAWMEKEFPECKKGCDRLRMQVSVNQNSPNN